MKLNSGAKGVCCPQASFVDITLPRSAASSVPATAVSPIPTQPTFSFAAPLPSGSVSEELPASAAPVSGVLSVTQSFPSAAASTGVGSVTIDDLSRLMNSRFDGLAAQLAKSTAMQIQLDSNTARIVELEEQNRVLAADLATLRESTLAQPPAPVEPASAASRVGDADIIISGAPCSTPEDLPLTVLRVASALGVPLTVDDIVTSRFLITREKARKDTPLPIVAKLRSRVTLSRLLAAKKAKGRLLTSELTPAPAGPAGSVNLNEAFLPDVYELLIATKAAAKTAGYQFVWHSAGTILVRRATGAQIQRIYSPADLTMLRRD